MFDRDGMMWFTDFGRLQPDGKRFGGLYCAAPDGRDITQIVAHALSYNGVRWAEPGMRLIYNA